MKYFYIIKRSGQTYEMNYTKEGYEAAIGEFIRGGILVALPKGYSTPQAINTKDITDILDEQGYENYIRTVKPKEYLRDGIWYDGVYRNEIRLEPWKQAEVKAKRIEAPKERPLTKEEEERAEEAHQRVREFVANGFK